MKRKSYVENIKIKMSKQMELKFKNSNMTCFQIVQIDQESKKSISWIRVQ